MNHPELLNKLGLTEEDLHEYLERRRRLAETLTDEQRRLVDTLRPTTAKVLKAFEPSVTAKELGEMFKCIGNDPVLICCLPGTNNRPKE